MNIEHFDNGAVQVTYAGTTVEIRQDGTVLWWSTSRKAASQWTTAVSGLQMTEPEEP